MSLSSFCLFSLTHTLTMPPYSPTIPTQQFTHHYNMNDYCHHDYYSMLVLGWHSGVRYQSHIVLLLSGICLHQILENTQYPEATVIVLYCIVAV